MRSCISDVFNFVNDIGRTSSKLEMLPSASLSNNLPQLHVIAFVLNCVRSALIFEGFDKEATSISRRQITTQAS